MSLLKKQALKLPLFCMPKKAKQQVVSSLLRDKPIELEGQSHQIPEPIEEIVDYTSNQYNEGESDLKKDLYFASDDERPVVEENIHLSVFGLAESALPITSERKEKSAPQTVRRADGISILSDRSTSGSGRRDSRGKDGQETLTPLPDRDQVDGFQEDAEGHAVFVSGSQSLAPVRESGVPTTARTATSLSIPGSARSHSLATQGTEPSDVRALKRTVRRLTSELGRLLTAHRADGKPVGEIGSEKLLPGKGPLPPWLCEPRVFAPLMAAYDSQLAGAADNNNSSSGVGACLLDMEARVLGVVRENERLRLKLRETATAGPACQTDWDAFAEQASLVLEENQLLIRQLSVQQAKARMAQTGCAAEAAKLRRRIEELEAENAQVRGEFDSLHRRLQEVRSKYQSAALERETGEMKTVDSMRSLSKELVDTREEFVRANEELLRQMQKSEREKIKLTQALSDAVTERDGLRLEVSELKGAMQLRHKEVLQQQKLARKQGVLQDHLQSVVGAASDLQVELKVSRDKLEDQEAELGRLISYLVRELKFHERSINGQAQMPKLTSKFAFVIRRYAAMFKENEEKREQMDQQICYLQSLIKERSLELKHLEAEHRTVQDGLDTILHAAISS